MITRLKKPGEQEHDGGSSGQWQDPLERSAPANGPCRFGIVVAPCDGGMGQKMARLDSDPALRGLPAFPPYPRPSVSIPRDKMSEKPDVGTRAPRTMSMPRSTRADSAARPATHHRPSCRARDGGDVSPAERIRTVKRVRVPPYPFSASRGLP